MTVTTYRVWTLGTRLYGKLIQDPVRQTVGLDLEVDAYPETALMVTVSRWSLRLAYQWVWR